VDESVSARSKSDHRTPQKGAAKKKEGKKLGSKSPPTYHLAKIKKVGTWGFMTARKNEEKSGPER